ncbi:pyocin knob domain-containing protein [Taibaiella koreensis]|uniref:pyocin knob domain-containing protein n=1 Tax=Taibaiella koreensis TaxID=1268548 RepID=UPI000E59DB6B|nr:pyocin knob domain-containing protein [Taibaiella koreensis]
MMATQNRCDNTPFPDGGQNLNALYFTKGPGEDYPRVYAQYNDDPCWVPLPLTLPAFPDLQQVRDAGRNISLATGSYEDAHFYLRSADGNNMTTAYFANGEGGGIQAGNATGYAPLNLQPDGGLLTYRGNEVATEAWVNSHALARNDTPVTNFNTVTASGIYTIYSGLTAISNYPNIGGNNNEATAGYLVVYGNGTNAVQFFYPTNESATLNRGGGHWYRRTATDVWEYKNGVLNIRTPVAPVHADALEITGEYFISGFRNQILAQGYPDPGTDIPLMLTVRKRWGNVSYNYAISQEAVCLQESPGNLTRKWIRSRFNWHGGVAWDGWNEVGLLRDVYTKAQLNTDGAGGAVHWNNVSNKPVIVSAETDPTVPAHVKGITQANIDSWNAKENATNKSAATTLGTSDILFPTQNAVKAYVDTAITNNNAGYIAVGQKGVANGVATLGSNGKIPDAQIPAIAITNTSTVASEAAMLALTAETGDVAVRTDINKSFILQAVPASALANWVELRSPTVTNSDQVPEGTNNLYFTNTRARNALSGSTPITYNSGTGQIGIKQAASGTNGYLSGADWNTFNSKEPAIAKNTAFNKNFGTVSGTVAEGNDSRINNGQTAYGWGNHAAAGYLKTETDPMYTADDKIIAKYRGHYEGADANTLTQGGWYDNGAGAPTGTNFPVLGAGFLKVTPYRDSSFSAVEQEFVPAVYFQGHLGRKWYRTSWNGVFTDWKEYLFKEDNVLCFKGDLPGGVDLNNYTTTGIYFQNNDINAQSGANYPIGFAGKLEVTSPYPNFVYQDYHSYADPGGGNNRRFWRSYYNGSWSAWKEAIQSLQAARNGDANVCDVSSGSAYYTAAIQLRENQFLGSGAPAGPRIAFHWSGIVASQIRMSNSGRIEVVNNPGTDLEHFAAKTISASGVFRFEANGNYMAGDTTAQFYTAGNAAWPIKAGGLMVSDSYADNAPVNGLFVKGNTQLRGDKTVIGRPIDPNEEITLVLGYSDTAGQYEKVKLISHRQDGAARQDFHIAINNEYSYASATIADSRLKIDGVTGNVSLAQLRGTGTRMVVANDAGVLSAQPLPADTSIYNTNGSLTGNRQVSVGANVLDFQAANSNRIAINGGSGQGVTIASPNIISIGDGSTGNSVLNALNIRYGGLAYAGIKTGNITAARTHQLPDSDGTYVLRINGVPADSTGNVSLLASDNWWDHNGYPANWVTPANTDSGPALGVETGGGLATRGITTRDTIRVVKPEDHTLIFGKTVSLEMPDPAEFPYRMLRLRISKGERILFSNLNICDIGSGSSLPEFEGCGDDCGLSRGHTVDLQSIRDEVGAWRWFITAITR